MTPAQKLAYAALALESVPKASPLFWRILSAINGGDGQGGEMRVAQ